jgi:type IV secretory pathway VirB6-like protein
VAATRFLHLSDLFRETATEGVRLKNVSTNMSDIFCYRMFVLKKRQRASVGLGYISWTKHCSSHIFT